MRELIIQLAEVENTAEGDLFGTLGIDWTLLLLQIISFAILVFILTKFVYPPIVAMLDRNDKKIADAVKATEEAQKNANKNLEELEERGLPALLEAIDRRFFKSSLDTDLLVFS